MKEKYSRTVGLEKDSLAENVPTEGGTAIQVTEYVEDQILTTISYIGAGGQIFKKELLMTQDEAFAVNALLTDWTSKRQH
jgi:hypothetical protein